MRYARKHFGEHNGRGLTTAYDSTQPQRTRTQARALDVTCPSCEAEPNSSCINLGKRPGNGGVKGEPCNTHPTRKRLAQRLWNQKHL